MGKMEDLEKLASLKKKGVINQKEFDKQKTLILDGGASTKEKSARKPKLSEPVKNGWMWWTAFFPLLAILLTGFIAGLCNGMGVDIEDAYTTSLVITIIIFICCNIFFTGKDYAYLKTLGVDDEKLKKSWWVPGYLFRRPKVVGGTSAYAWIWVVLFVIWLFV